MVVRQEREGRTWCRGEKEGSGRYGGGDDLGRGEGLERWQGALTGARRCQRQERGARTTGPNSGVEHA